MRKIRNCLVCNEKEIIPLFETHDRMFDVDAIFTVKRCQRCGLVFIDPIPEDTILKKHYPSKNYYSYQETEEKGFFYRLRSYLVRHYYKATLFSLIFSSLVQKVPALPKQVEDQFTDSGGKILDLGCGSGDTIFLLQELGWDVYGLEIDRKAVSIARERGLLNVKYGGYEKIDNFPNNYFDAIRLYHVIEHLNNPTRCLRLIYKKLKPRGELIMGTPNIDSLTSRVFKKFWYNLDIPRHLFLFSPKTLSRMTKEEGFSRINIEFCSAGGLIGSVVYLLNNFTGRRYNPNNFLWLFFLFYPLEWLLDKIKLGDIFILRAIKK